MKSTDGGTSWTKVLSPRNGIGIATDASTNDRVADIEIGSNDILYASFGIFSNGKIYQSSTSAGTSWTDITPSGGSPNRIEIALAPSTSGTTASTTLYAVAHGGSGSNDVEWFKKSTDGGANWSDINIPSDLGSGNHFTRGQAWYDLILAVHPTNPNLVIAGGIDLHRSIDGGTSWDASTAWYLDPTNIFYSHADHHSIIFRPGNSNEVIVGNDGGLSYSTTFGDASLTAGTSDVTFATRIQDYNVTQFYSCATKNEFESNYFLAGAQDNGSHKFTTTGINATEEVTGGDGAFCFIDQDDPDYQITSFVRNNWRRSTDNGTSFSNITSSNSGRFINPADYDNTANILYAAAGNNQIYRVSGIDGTITAETLTTDLNSGQASAFTVSPYTANRLFVGTGSGYIFQIDNTHTGTTVTTTELDDTSTPVLPGGYISCIEVGKDDNHLLVTYSSYGVNSVWETLDGGNNWENKDNASLPDMPIRWAIYNPADYREVLLATEAGVYSTNDFNESSPTWGPTNTDLANVRCDMIQYRPIDGTVVIATHGRGLFTTDAFSSPYTWTGANSSNWNDANNWIPKTVPTGSDNVLFPQSVNNRVTVTNELDFNTAQACNNFTVGAGRTLNIGGNLTINGTISAEGTVIFDGTTVQTITAGGDFENLIINNSNDVSLSADISVSGNLSINSGNLDANNNTVTLGTTGNLAETAGYFFAGTITAEGEIDNETKNIGGLGAVITTTENMGTTTITRQHIAPVDNDFVEGISRTYDISPNNNAGLGATLIYNFSPLDAGTVDLPTAKLYRSTSGGDDTWVDRGGTVAGNTITVSSIDAFSSWAGGGSSTALPVLFMSFQGERVSLEQVKLTWETASEINNRGFTIEMSTDGVNFRPLGFVDGVGSSNERRNYEFIAYQKEGAYYRLKQIDFDENFKYSTTIFVAAYGISSVARIYPNPFTQDDELKIELASGYLNVRIFDTKGQQIFQIAGVSEEIRKTLSDKLRSYPSGLYLLNFVDGKDSYNLRLIKK